jgi:acetoacetyl-CoA synthetase
VSAPPRVLWKPSDETVRNARITSYIDHVRSHGGPAVDGYADLWAWSVDDLSGFWSSIWEFFDVRAASPPTTVLDDPEMPGARWFEGATLNYAEHVLRHRGDEVAIRAFAEGVEPREMSRDELAHAVGSVASALRAMGVSEGDRVAAYLPNGIEAIVAVLATASIGAIWSACSPDFGPGAVIDRFRQIEPTALITVDGYRYAGREHDRVGTVASIVEQLPSLRSVVLVQNLGAEAAAIGPVVPWDQLLQDPREPAFAAVPFSHPLWILYSSGTTGLPKAMVQGHGGILLEHLKSLGLHLDLGPNDRLFWFTTTGWMMWNFIVSGLALGSSLVLYDGSPATPDLGALWRLAERAGITYFGTSAPFVHASMKRRIRPRDAGDLSALRAIGSTGAPLTSDGFAWIYDELGPDVWLGSISGGTDLCTAFVGSCPILPVHAGEIQCRTLGAKVAAYDEHGRPVTDRVGELVIEAPMPSMPLSFWNDQGGRRYRESYFDVFPGVWRHGDWIEVTSRGTCRIHGRSDATLNRGGVRIGTAEFYRVVETLDGVKDSLVVDTGDPTRDGRLVLFVVLDEGIALDADLTRRIGDRLRDELSPRHVPDAIVEAPGVPTTLNGKRMEVPVKRLLHGEPLDDVASLDAVADADLLRWYAERAPELARRR